MSKSESDVARELIAALERQTDDPEYVLEVARLMHKTVVDYANNLDALIEARPGLSDYDKSARNIGGLLQMAATILGPIESLGFDGIKMFCSLHRIGAFVSTHGEKELLEKIHRFQVETDERSARKGKKGRYKDD